MASQEENNVAITEESTTPIHQLSILPATSGKKQKTKPRKEPVETQVRTRAQTNASKCSTCSKICATTNYTIKCYGCNLGNHQMCDVCLNSHQSYQENWMKKTGYYWFCNTCRPKLEESPRPLMEMSTQTVSDGPPSSVADELSQMKSQINQISYDINQKLETLKVQNLQQRMSKIEENQISSLTKSRSEPVASTSRQKLSTRNVPHQVSHQVIVTNDENTPMSQKSFADSVRGNLRNVQISNIKVVKEGFGVIEFPNKESRDDGFSKLKEDFKVQINNRPHRNLLPKITISGIQSADYKEGDALKLQNAICEKNQSIKQLIEQGNTFEILFIKEDWQKNNFSVAAVKISKEIYSEIRQLKYQLYIDFTRCRVSDRFHLPQCYGCQKFGHTSNNCQMKEHNIQVCRYCAENHQSKSCPHKGQRDMYKCANCGSNHTSTYIKCPVVQSQLQSLLNRTQGAECLSKNDIRPHALVT